MWVLLNVEVVIVINLIVSVVSQAVWIEIVFTVVWVLNPVHFIVIVMMSPMLAMVCHWLEFKVRERHFVHRMFERQVIMCERKILWMMRVGDIDFNIM